MPAVKKTAKKAVAKKAPVTKVSAKKVPAKKAPAKVAPKVAKKALSAKAEARSTLMVGQPAPAFSLADASGTQVSLASYAGQWVVLYFYPRDDTPGCTTEACEFTSMWSDFMRLGAKVVGVSPDKTEAHKRFIAKYDLKVTLLSDPDKKTLAAYGAYGEKVMYGQPVIGVIRSTVIIDPTGRVAKHWPTVKAAGHAVQVKEALAALQA